MEGNDPEEKGPCAKRICIKTKPEEVPPTVESEECEILKSKCLDPISTLQVRFNAFKEMLIRGTERDKDSVAPFSPQVFNLTQSFPHLFPIEARREVMDFVQNHGTSTLKKGVCEQLDSYFQSPHTFGDVYKSHEHAEFWKRACLFVFAHAHGDFITSQALACSTFLTIIYSPIFNLQGFPDLEFQSVISTMDRHGNEYQKSLFCCDVIARNFSTSQARVEALKFVSAYGNLYQKTSMVGLFKLKFQNHELLPQSFLHNGLE